MSSAPLKLRDVNRQRVHLGRWHDEPGDWLVQAPLEKLREQYRTSPSALFDHYVFHFRHDPNRLGTLDLEAAERLIGAELAFATRRLIEDPRLGDPLAAILSRIPREASLGDAGYDADIAAAIALLRSAHGMRLQTATTLLAIKRPHLVPQMDAVVQLCFFRTKEPATILRGFRRVITDAESGPQLGQLCQAVHEETGIEVSPVRVLDRLIGFDWSLQPRDDGRFEVTGFPRWLFDPANEALGVHLPA
jgi:hypothetical protein